MDRLAGFVGVCLALLVAIGFGSPWTPHLAVTSKSGAASPLLRTYLEFSHGPTAAAGSSPGDWPTYLANLMRTANNSAETNLSASDVGNLKQLWSFSTAGGVGSSPAFVGGTVYVGSWDGHEYALNGSTGALVWMSPFLGQTSGHGCNFTAGITSSAAVQNGIVYVGGGNESWYALDAAKGSILWSLNLRQASGGTGVYYNWASPLLYGNAAYIGVSSYCDSPLVPGGLLRVDLTSHLSRFFNTTPPGQIGASVWGSPSLDPATQTVYFATGNPYKLATEPEPLAESVVAVNASTLGLVSFWHVPAALQVPDGDFGNTPTLFSGNGKLFAAATDKDGIAFAWNRSDLAAGPVWQYRISDDASEAPAAFGQRLLFVAGHETNLTVNGVTKHYFGSVRAFHPDTGTLVWQRGVGGNVLGAPAYANGILAVAAGHKLEVLNAATGKVLFKSLSFPGPLFSAPIIAHGEIIVGCMDGKVYAFGIPPTAPAPAFPSESLAAGPLSSPAVASVPARISARPS